MIDYQVKGNVIRFKDEQFAFLFRLSIWVTHLKILL
jgi:hypothetical protein